MSPEDTQEVRRIIHDELQELLASDRYIFHKTVQYLDGRNIQFATGTGTKIGTEPTQKLAFWGDTPIAQPSAIADVSGGGGDSDGTARSKINALLAALRTTGIIDT